MGGGWGGNEFTVKERKRKCRARLDSVACRTSCIHGIKVLQWYDAKHNMYFVLIVRGLGTAIC